MRVLVLAATALAISAASASANGYRHHYGYGYATPVFEYEAGAYYGYPAPSYIHTPCRYMRQCRSMQRLWFRRPRLATHLVIGAVAIGAGTVTDMGGASIPTIRHESPSRLDSLS
jgi:hypothetical protein